MEFFNVVHSEASAPGPYFNRLLLPSGQGAFTQH